MRVAQKISVKSYKTDRRKKKTEKVTSLVSAYNTKVFGKKQKHEEHSLVHNRAITKTKNKKERNRERERATDIILSLF